MVRQLIRRGINLAPLSALRVLVPRNVIGLSYHVVSDDRLAHIRHLYAYKTPAQFEQDLVYLRRTFDLLSYDQAVQRVRDPASVRRPGVLVTFDDALAECFTTVRPLLLEHRVPCVFFAATDFLDNRRMFYRHKVSLCIERCGGLTGAGWRAVDAEFHGRAGRPVRDPGALAAWLRSLYDDEESIDAVCEWLGLDIGDILARTRPYLSADQLRQLAADGFTIGGHSRSHRRLDGAPEPVVALELVASCRAIQALTGQAQVPFAFPFSAENIDRDFLQRLLVKHPSLGLLFGSNGVERDAPFLVNRIPSDRPGDVADRSSNLPRLLRTAYAREALRAVSR